MARVLLALALVAMLFVGSFAAAQQPAHGGGHKYKGKSCAKAFPGCKKCSGSGISYTCDSCKDANAVFDSTDGKCVCDSDSGYGTLSKSQYKAWKKSNKTSYLKHSSGCVLCENYDLVAEDGKCVKDISATTGRRLFALDA